MKWKPICAILLTLGMVAPSLSGCGLVVKTEEAKKRDADKLLNLVLAEGDGDIKVTYGEVKRGFDSMMGSYKAMYGEEFVASNAAQFESQKIGLMDNALYQQLLAKKGEELAMKKDDPALVKEVEALIKQQTEAAGGADKLEASLKESQGMTLAEYKKKAAEEIYVKKVLEAIHKDLKVTDAEIQKYYEANKANYKVKPGADLYHIFFGKPEDKAAVAKAKEAKAKLDAGAAFAEVAKEYGQDDSASKGGFLGTHAWDTETLSKDFLEHAMKLPEGVVSPPVQTTFGWHLIKVENVVKEERQQALTDKVSKEDGSQITLKDEIKEVVLGEKKEAKTAQVLDELEKKYKVKRYPDRMPMSDAAKKLQEEENASNASNASQGK